MPKICYKNITQLLLISCFFFVLLNAGTQKVYGYTPLDQESSKITSISYSSKKIEEYFKKMNGKFAFYYLNIENGETMEYQSNKIFSAASTIKLPLALYIYTLADQNKINLEEELTYRSYHYYGGSGVIQHDKVGTKYTIKDLVKKAMVHSDNIAFIMLREKVGRDNFIKFARDIGGKNAYRNGRNQTTGKELVLYAQAVYDFSLKNEKLGQELITHLQNTDYKKTIPAGVEGIPVAHKVGYIPNRLLYNDVGIVFDEDSPYIVSILTLGIPYVEEEETIAEATKLIHEIHKENNKAAPKNLTKKLYINREVGLYNIPNTDFPSKRSIEPQTVEVIQNYKDWYKINTWLGPKWISYADGHEKTPIKIVADGKDLAFDQPPVIENGHTLVPLRGMFEALGSKVSWDGVKREIHVTKGNTFISLKVDSMESMINGKVTKTDFVPKINNGITFVPIKFVSDVFEQDIKWNNDERIIYLSNDQTVNNIAATAD